MNYELMTPLEKIEDRIERRTRAAWYENGLDFYDIKHGKKFRERGEWLTWDQYCLDRWGKTSSNIDRIIDNALSVAEIPRILGNNTIQLPYAESQAIELAKLEKPEQRAEVWRRVLSLNTSITAKVVESEVIRYQAELSKNWITLFEWNQLADEEKLYWLQYRKTGSQFNKTNDNIEWARWSWNPITGCEHNCNYCYARDMANRFYPQRFEPSLYLRLDAPENTKPSIEFGGDKVFVCSMADLFGKWVPEEWITSVLSSIRANPQWIFLLLTKFPIRMADFDYPSNVWLGTTVDKQYAVERAEKAFRKIKASGFAGVCWLSCEPMLERLTFTSLDMFDWVVVGGASSSTQTPEYLPPFDDIVHIYKQARVSNCMVYMKTNLLGDRIKEYPNKELPQ